MSDNNDKLAKFTFEGNELTFYNFKGRQCVIAKVVGALMTYGDEGTNLTTLITHEWAKEFRPGRDFLVVKGDDLRDLKQVFERTGCYPVGPNASHVMLLTETGFDLVCLKTDKEIGLRIRRWLVDEVMPKLRRGETIPGKGEVTGWTDEKFKAFKKHLRDLVSLGLMPEEDAQKHLTVALRAYTGYDLTKPPHVTYVTSYDVPMATPAALPTRVTDLTGFHTIPDWYFYATRAKKDTFKAEEATLSFAFHRTMSEYLKAQDKEPTDKKLVDEAHLILHVLGWHLKETNSYKVTPAIRAVAENYCKMEPKGGYVVRDGILVPSSNIFIPNFNRAAIEGVVAYAEAHIPEELVKKGEREKVKRDREEKKAAAAARGKARRDAAEANRLAKEQKRAEQKRAEKEAARLRSVGESLPPD